MKQQFYLVLAILFAIGLAASPVAGLWLAAQTGIFSFMAVPPAACATLAAICINKAEAY